MDTVKAIPWNWQRKRRVIDATNYVSPHGPPSLPVPSLTVATEEPLNSEEHKPSHTRPGSMVKHEQHVDGSAPGLGNEEVLGGLNADPVMTLHRSSRSSHVRTFSSSSTGSSFPSSYQRKTLARRTVNRFLACPFGGRGLDPEETHESEGVALEGNNEPPSSMEAVMEALHAIYPEIYRKRKEAITAVNKVFHQSDVRMMFTWDCPCSQT